MSNVNAQLGQIKYLMNSKKRWLDRLDIHSRDVNHPQLSSSRLSENIQEVTLHFSPPSLQSIFPQGRSAEIF